MGCVNMSYMVDCVIIEVSMMFMNLIQNVNLEGISFLSFIMCLVMIVFFFIFLYNEDGIFSMSFFVLNGVNFF